MSEYPPEIVFAEGHPVRRRGLAWLKIHDNTEVNAKSVFDGLAEEKRDYLNVSFDQWLSFKPDNNRYHGWPNEPEFKACHQFTFKDRTGRNRLYGFKTSLKIPEALELCVLAIHAWKNTKHTDPYIKRTLVRFLNDEQIQRAIVQQINLLTKTK